jgi:hypothetical protein
MPIGRCGSQRLPGSISRLPVSIGFAAVSHAWKMENVTLQTSNREPEDEPAASMVMFCAMSFCFGGVL